jgi:probable addiction module antidote protein
MADPDHEVDDLSKAVARINVALLIPDIDLFGEAMSDAIALHNVAEISRESKIERTSLYRAFGRGRHPAFMTVLNVLKAMGFRLKVVRARKSRRGAG